MKNLVVLFLGFFFTSAVISQIPTDNLVVYLPFNGSAADFSGNELNGVVIGAELTTDRFESENQAYDFDGVLNQIIIPSSPLLELSFPFTVSLWYFREESPDDIQILFKSDAFVGIQSGFWINMDSDGHLVAAYGDALGYGVGHRLSKKSSLEPSPGEWHHVLAVYNTLNDIDLYIDCLLDPGTYSGTGTSIGYLGEDASIALYDWMVFDGKIDNFRIYEDAILSEEIMTFCEEEPCEETILIEEIINDTIIIRDTTIFYDTLTYFDTIIHIDTIQYVDTISYIDTVAYFDTIIVEMSQLNNNYSGNSVMKLFANSEQNVIFIEFGEDYSYFNEFKIKLLTIGGDECYETSISEPLTKIDINLLELPTGFYYLSIVDPQFGIRENWIFYTENN